MDIISELFYVLYVLNQDEIWKQWHVKYRSKDAHVLKHYNMKEYGGRELQFYALYRIS
jgi:hypothetical protein